VSRTHAFYAKMTAEQAALVSLHDPERRVSAQNLTT
jgi:hypothetical protein